MRANVGIEVQRGAAGIPKGELRAASWLRHRDQRTYKPTRFPTTVSWGFRNMTSTL